MPAPAGKAEAPYFAWENVQLTAAILANLTNLKLTDVNLFGFPPTGPVPAAASASGQCKVFPGDPTYPPPLVWQIFNLLTGGAVIQTVPLAAPCYPGPEYNPTQCAYVTANWFDPHLQ